MFFFQTMGIGLILLYGVGSMIAVIVIAIAAIYYGKKEKKRREEWERTWGAEIRRLNELKQKEIAEMLKRNEDPNNFY